MIAMVKGTLMEKSEGEAVVMTAGGLGLRVMCSMNTLAALPAAGNPERGKEDAGLYPYHNKNKQRIRAGELIDCCFTEEYPGIGRAMVLVFDSPPFLRPVRPHAWGLYTDVLQEWSRQRGGDGR